MKAQKAKDISPGQAGPIDWLDNIIEKHRVKPGAVLKILEEIQEYNKHKYLPAETLKYISKKIPIPLSRLFSVVTFYSFFNLQPQGKHTITICRGTACHTRGSRRLLDCLRPYLKIEENSEGDEHDPLTTKDKKFTIRTVACFGQCALAPVIAVDGIIFSHMTKEKLYNLLKSFDRKVKKKK